jgi:hypothetical protein
MYQLDILKIVVSAWEKVAVIAKINSTGFIKAKIQSRLQDCRIGVQR